MEFSLGMNNLYLCLNAPSLRKLPASSGVGIELQETVVPDEEICHLVRFQSSTRVVGQFKREVMKSV